jgi:hypothetical protein
MRLAQEELDDCKYLFLIDITEGDDHSLSLKVVEGITNEVPEEIWVDKQSLGKGNRIEVTGASRNFELRWPSYITYTVRNESYCQLDKTEHFQGNKFRTYTKSHFLDFRRRATFATEGHPGPLFHVGIVCEDHVIDVISTAVPDVIHRAK